MLLNRWNYEKKTSKLNFISKEIGSRTEKKGMKEFPKKRKQNREITHPMGKVFKVWAFKYRAFEKWETQVQ